MHTFVLRNTIAAILLSGVLGFGRAAEPVRLVLDTDLGNDVDDALALALIHALQSRGECELLAVTVTKSHSHAAAFADAINTFYGRGNIPIGLIRGGPTPDIGKFLGLVDVMDEGRSRYPQDLLGSGEIPEATAVLRRVLAAQPDHSLVIVQVGFSSNLARLLDSKPDEITDLTGLELVRRKVRLLSIMAGAFQPIHGKTHLEFNVVKDIPSAKKIASEWPTPILWSGYEIGISLPYPASSIERDFSWVPHHPVAEAYRLYQPPPHNRPTWDLTSVLVAVRPAHEYFALSEPGRVTVLDNGETRFDPNPEGTHRYLRLPANAAPRILEAFVNLCSQPPNRLLRP